MKTEAKSKNTKDSNRIGNNKLDLTRIVIAEMKNWEYIQKDGETKPEPQNSTASKTNTRGRNNKMRSRKKVLT